MLIPGNSSLESQWVLHSFYKWEKVNSEIWSGISKAPYLWKWWCESYIVPKSIFLLFYLKIDVIAFFSTHQFLMSLFGFNRFSEGASLCEIHPELLNTNSNPLKLLRVNTRSSDRQPCSLASISWECKSNIYLFIWPEVERINSGHWPLINVCWNHVLNTQSS